MSDEKNHDGPHVIRESDGKCGIQFCKNGRYQEHAPVDPPPWESPWRRDERGNVGGIFASIVTVIVLCVLGRMMFHTDPVTWLDSAVDWSVTIVSDLLRKLP